MNKTETKCCKSTYLINCCGVFCWQHSQRYKFNKIFCIQYFVKIMLKINKYIVCHIFSLI